MHASGTRTPPRAARSRRIARRVSRSGGPIRAIRPDAMRERSFGSSSSSSDGQRSAENTTVFPCSTRWSSVWKSSACVARLPTRNWTSSRIKRFAWRR